jgi:hypothetical protein
MKTTIKNTQNFQVTISLVCLLYGMIMVFAFNKANAQSGNGLSSQSRNTIYFETIGATGLGGSLNYKYSVKIGKSATFNASAGVGCILYSFNGDPDMVLPFSVTLGHGNNKSFEWGLGLSVITTEKILAPNITMGYCHRKGSFFFWAGVVTLLFLDDYNTYDYQYADQKTKWEVMAVIPAPGIRIGKTFEGKKNR